MTSNFTRNCDICGNKPEIKKFTQGDLTLYNAECPKCHRATAFCYSPEDALSDWNNSMKDRRRERV